MMSTTDNSFLDTSFSNKDKNMMNIKLLNSQIKILASDLKSKKNLIGKNAEIIYNNEELGRFKGKISGGLPHGFGVKNWPDGKRYQG